MDTIQRGSALALHGGAALLAPWTALAAQVGADESQRPISLLISVTLAALCIAAVVAFMFYAMRRARPRDPNAPDV